MKHNMIIDNFNDKRFIEVQHLIYNCIISKYLLCTDCFLNFNPFKCLFFLSYVYLYYFNIENKVNNFISRYLRILHTINILYNNSDYIQE